jgi:pimeloyl-ACP methyl ester carboxylesterase
MMPFSSLRFLFTGVLSWAILIGGIYCLWKWRHEVSQAAHANAALVRPHEPRPGRGVPEDRRDAGEMRAEENPETDKRALAYLAAGIALLAFSVGGFVPVSLLLSKPSLEGPTSERTGTPSNIDRPDGTQLHVETHGNPAGPTIVFTHGWSLDSTAWHYAKQELSDQFRLVVWDLPGLGRSKGPTNGDYSLEKMAGDLLAVIEHAGGGPVILVGHSIGGMINQTFCRLYAQHLHSRVAGIVLLHTTYTNPVRTAWLANLLTALEKPLIVPMNHLSVWLAPLFWLQNLQSYLSGSLHITVRIWSFAGGQTAGQLNYAALLAVKAWPAVVGRGNLAMLEFDETATLRHVDVPVLVIGAQHDRMTRHQASEQIESWLPQGVLASVNAGHLGLWEAHKETNELIRQFAEQHGAKELEKLRNQLDRQPTS